MLTREELTFLYQLLDQITVRGLPNKQVVLVIMAKLAQELEKEEQVSEESGDG